jgi:PAS domain-containing protein
VPQLAETSTLSPLQRIITLAGACVPLLAVGLVVVLNPRVSGFELFLDAGLATVVVVVLLYIYTRQQAALHRSADMLRQTLNDQRILPADLREVIGELTEEHHNPQVRVLRDLSERLATREGQLKDLVNRMTAAMTAIVHHRRGPSLEGLELPTSTDRLVVIGAYREFLRTLVRMKKRTLAVAEVLRRVPVALVVANRQGKMQSMNVTAERLFGKKSAAIQGVPLETLFANAPFGIGSPDFLLLVQHGKDVLERLREGEDREVFTTVRAARGQITLIGVRGYFGKQQILIFRERNPKPLNPPVATKDAETIPTAAQFVRESTPSAN